MSSILSGITPFCPLIVNRCFGRTCQQALITAFIIRVSCLDYSYVFSIRRRLSFAGLHGVLSQKIELSSTSYVTEVGDTC
jgi:hypothetical protein